MNAVPSARGQNLVYEYGQWQVDLGRRELLSNGVAAPIGARAFEIFELLVQSANELVTKNDIMSGVWPGASIGENTLHVHATAIRKALGPNRDLLKTVSGRGYRLLGNWTPRQHGSVSTPSSSPLIAPSINNSFPLAGRLIGRAAAARHVRDLASAYRVVTLTGPGGIGKTSLAIEAARGLLADFDSGAWFVELASLSNPDLLAHTVASTLGMKLSGEISAESVARELGAKHLLLVLDNCEHIIDTAANLAERLTRLCPRTTILVTSREVLRIDGEAVYRVPALDVPAPGHEMPDHILGHSAVELFITRMNALDAGSSPHSEELTSVAAICRRLDGIPLAIEFAAASAATLGIASVATGLRDRFALLTRGRRTSLPRHRTLRATLDWSYQLLGEAGRRLLRHLGVFPAGFTLEAAVAVMQDFEIDASAVIDGIADLVAKSLVTVDRSARATRWYLLETIKVYAVEKLTESGEISTATRRFSVYFRDLATRLAPLANFSPGSDALAECFREIDNTRAALDWAFSPSGDVEIGVTLAGAYVPVWLRYSLAVECRERTEQALECLESIEIPGTDLRMHLLLGLGIALIFGYVPIERSSSVLGMALDIAERSGNLDAQIRALYGLWSVNVISRTIGKPAQEMAERILTLASRIGDTALLPVAHRALGFSLLRSGHLVDARVHLERVLNFDASVAQEQEMWFLYNQRVLARAMLSRALLAQGFAEQAEVAAKASLDEAIQGGSNHTLCVVLSGYVGSIAVMTGNQAVADRTISFLEDITTKRGFMQHIRMAHLLQGMLAIARSEFHSGVALLSAELEANKAEDRKSIYPCAFGPLADGLAELGHLTNALAIVDEGLAISDATGERWDVPELLRIKGEVLLRRSNATSDPAEHCFNRAAELAQEQGALFWELRIALSLARLRMSQGRNQEASALLAPVYERFTEGFATADLRAARAMLDALPT